MEHPPAGEVFLQGDEVGEVVAEHGRSPATLHVRHGGLAECVGQRPVVLWFWYTGASASSTGDGTPLIAPVSRAVCHAVGMTCAGTNTPPK